MGLNFLDYEFKKLTFRGEAISSRKEKSANSRKHSEVDTNVDPIAEDPAVFSPGER